MGPWFIVLLLLNTQGQTGFAKVEKPYATEEACKTDLAPQLAEAKRELAGLPIAAADAACVSQQQLDKPALDKGEKL
jgi:hypothetical protein